MQSKKTSLSPILSLDVIIYKMSKNIVEIKETGSYFDVDDQGYIVNPASLDKIQKEWRLILDAIVTSHKENFKDKLVAVYVRGSVAKGEAIEEISDVDSFAYVDIPQEDIDRTQTKKSVKEIHRQFPFVQSIEMEVDSITSAPDDQFWIGQSALVYGRDLQTKRFKIGRDIIFHLEYPDKTPAVQNKLAKGMRPEEVCVWLCKQILRSGIELCYERSGRYSRDIYRCFETFSEYYPEKSVDMKQVLFLALNPTSDESEILKISQDWAEWLSTEKTRLGY